MLNKICQYCKKKFKVKKERAKYCSISCMARAFTGRKLDKEKRAYAKVSERRISPELKEQLRLLEILRSNNLISEEEYQKRKEKLLSH